MKKKTIFLLLGGAAGGFVVAFFLFSQAEYRGCAFDVSVSWPPSLRFDCAGAPQQVAVNFGSRPSQMPLATALKIIAERTQSRGAARIFVDQSLLTVSAASALVDPPAGPQPSLDMVKGLIGQAHANSIVGICLVPEGGYEVRALKWDRP